MPTETPVVLWEVQAMTTPPTKNSDDSNQQQRPSSVEYSVSGGLAGRLSALNASFGLTSYQSNILYMIGRNRQGGINVHQSIMPRPMGLSVNLTGDIGSGMTMTAGYQIMRFENVLAADQLAYNLFDKCYAPRVTHVTGALDAHDVGLDKDGRPVFVNTRFNGQDVPSEKHYFEEIWRPSIISEPDDEDS